MNTPATYAVSPAEFDAQIGDRVRLVGGEIQPLTMEVAAVFEDRYQMASRWFHGFDKQGRFHTVRVHPAA